MARAGISGIGVAVATGGAFVLYASVQDVPLLDGARQLLQGQTPTPRPKPAGSAGGGGGSWLTSIASDPLGGFGAVGGATANLGAAADIAGAGGAQLADAARKYLGWPYKWGYTFADRRGGDCSGLVYRSFHDIGKNTPRLTTAGYIVWNQVQKVDRAAVGAGDLLWYPGHIAIAVSNSQMIEAPTFGVPVRIASIRSNPTPLRYIGGW